MKKNHKLLSLALAVLLCSVCLSACGSVKPNQANTTITPGVPESTFELGLEMFCYRSHSVPEEYTYQFDYLDWGSSLEDVSLAVPFALERNAPREFNDPTIKVYTSVISVELDGVSSWMHFTFENEELIRIDLSFKPEDNGTWFNTQLEKLIELYGESLSASNEMAETHRWRTDVSQLQIARQLRDNSVQLIVGTLPPPPEATITAADFGSDDGYSFRGIDNQSSLEDVQAVLPFTFYPDSASALDTSPGPITYFSQTPITLDGVEGDLWLDFENEKLTLVYFRFPQVDTVWFDAQLDAFTELYGEGEFIDAETFKNYMWRGEQTLLVLNLFGKTDNTSAAIKLFALDE